MSTETNTEARTCTCSCGEPLGPKATYRPGHDARHVSMLLGGLYNVIQDGGKVTQRMIDAEAKALPSEALQRKLRKAAERMMTKATQAQEVAK